MKYLHPLKTSTKSFYPKNSFNTIKSLKPESFIYANLLATKIKLCVYTNSVLPSAFLLRFIKVRDPSTDNIWLTPDGIYESNRGSKGIWLTCSSRIIDLFLKEKFYRTLEKGIMIRKDLTYHVYYLFNLEILRLFKNIEREDIVEIKEDKDQTKKSVNFYITLKILANSEDKQDLLKIVYPKKYTLPTIGIQYNNNQPEFMLNGMLTTNVLNHMISDILPSSIIKDKKVGSMLRLGIKLSENSLELYTALYRLGFYLNK